MRMDLEVVDNDFNLAGDHVEGTPIGRLQLGETIGTEFSADLRARLDAISCQSDKDCQGGFICGVEAQTLNTCEADFSCKAPIGARIAGERCVDNAQCASGVARQPVFRCLHRRHRLPNRKSLCRRCGRVGFLKA